MHRAITLAIVFAAGCGIENDLTTDYPQFPEGDAQPLEQVSQTDSIVQVTTPKVDILWTIDNSCSMFNEQEALTDNFGYFMDYFTGSGLDFHVGVVSTDLDNASHYGKLRSAAGVTFIEEDTPSPTEVFTSMASMGTSGSGTERGLGATYLAIEINKDTFNQGYYRDEAAIHTVLISDEQDQTQPNLITQDEFIDWYDGLKREADQRTFSSIVSPPGGGVYDGSAYIAATASIGGIWWDITDPNWAEVLDRLGVQASGLKREYYLSQQPVPGTIVVEVHQDANVFKFDEAVLDIDGNLLEGDWTYDQSRNSITFLEYVPEALAKVVLHYDLLAAAQDEAPQSEEL